MSSSSYRTLESVTAPSDRKSYEAGIYKRRGLMLTNALEVILNSVKGTLLRGMQLALNNAAQQAYTLQLANQSTQIALANYLSTFPIFTITLLSLTIYDTLARMWRTNIFVGLTKEASREIYPEAQDKLPFGDDVENWLRQQADKLANENDEAKQKKLAKDALKVMLVYNMKIDNNVVAVDRFKIHVKDLDYPQFMQELKINDQGYLSAIKRNDNSEVLSNGLSNNLEWLKNQIKRRHAIHLDPDRNVEQFKGYWNLTQNMVMAPIELGMYLYTLGPEILGIIFGLSLAIGQLQIIISKKREAAKNRLSSQTTELKTSEDGYSDGVTNILDAYLGVKNADIYSDAVKNFFLATFQLMLMSLCTYFLFNGRYDLALMMAQTSSGLLAFGRIAKYLGLIGNHKSFEALMTNYRLNARYQDDTFDEKFQQYMATVPTFKWGAGKKALLYSALAIIGLRFITIPLPAFSITLTRRHLLSLGAVVLTSMRATNHTKPQEVSGKYLAHSLQISIGLLALSSIMHYQSISMVLISAYQQAPLLVSGYSAASLAVLYGFDTYMRVPVLTVLDQVGTWASQEYVAMCKLPQQAGSIISHKSSPQAKV